MNKYGETQDESSAMLDVFKENKYYTWYQEICKRAETRTLDEYTERHHIIPSAVVGKRSFAKNLTVRLTPREHFICHWLLTKCIKDRWKHKMLYALSAMSFSRKLSSRHYQIAAKAAADARRGKKWSDKSRLKLSESCKGRPSSMKGKKHRPESIEKMRISKIGFRHPFFGKKRPEHARLMSKRMKGREMSEAHKQHISDTWQESRQRITCMHCQTVTTKAMHTRWHGDNCRRKAA